MRLINTLILQSASSVASASCTCHEHNSILDFSKHTQFLALLAFLCNFWCKSFANSSNANLDLSHGYIDLKMMSQIIMSSLFSILSDIKMPILSTLCMLENYYITGEMGLSLRPQSYMLSSIEDSYSWIVRSTSKQFLFRFTTKLNYILSNFY